MPIELFESDYEKMTNFGLRWRWTEERGTLLPEAIEREIRPVKEETAARLLRHSLALYEDLRSATSKYQEVLSLGCGDEVPVPKIAASLHEQLPVDGEQVVVSWDNSHAVHTLSGIFCRFWDDFCYPSSDDVMVWPQNEEWILVYWHYENFTLYRRRI